MKIFSEIKDFMHFVDWYEGELVLNKNKALCNGEVIAEWKN